MIHRLAPLALFAAASCAGSSDTRAQAPVEVAPVAPVTDGVEVESVEEESAAVVQPDVPAPWTGAFVETAVMLADVVRIEGPVGLLDHVVSSSDDAYYERTVETTPRGLRQVVRRVGVDVPEIRVQLDAWKLAAFDRVVILERVEDVPVQVVASGSALWRNPDGMLAEGDRLAFVGEIGNDTPVVPDGAVMTARPQDEPVIPESHPLTGGDVSEGVEADEVTVDEPAVTVQDGQDDVQEEPDGQPVPDESQDADRGVDVDADVESEVDADVDADSGADAGVDAGTASASNAAEDS